MMFKRILFVLFLFVAFFSLSSFASAAEYEFPVYVGDQGFSNLSDALLYPSEDPITVVGVVSLIEYTRFDHRTLVVSQSGTIQCNGFSLGLRFSDFYLYGHVLSQSSSVSYAIISSHSNLYLYGDIISASIGLEVYQTSSVLFSGSMISAYSYAVRVQSDAISSSLIVDGGSFYSEIRASVLSPLEAFSFPDGLDVIYQNGRIFAVSPVSLFSDIGRIVFESVVWIQLLVHSIMDNTLLLIFFIVVFVCLAIGLLRRSIYL